MSHREPDRPTSPTLVLRLSREPALLLIGAIAPLAQLLLSFTTLPLPVTTGLNAVAVAVAGVLTAAFLRRDQLVPAVLGLAQAVLVLGLGLGVHVDATQQALVMTVAGIGVAAFVRTQVATTAPPDQPAD